MAEQPITVAGRRLDKSRHICSFFHTKQEEYRVFLPFIKEGLDRGEKALHIVDAALLNDHFERLASAGINTADCIEARRLEVRTWEEAYLRGGAFDQYAMLSLIEELLQDAKAQGYPLARLIAHMEWALKDVPAVQDLIEYETRLNCILPKYPDAVICTYDLARFPASVVIDILRTHPMVLIEGVLQENPFFIPPDQFLRELQMRRSPVSTY